MQAIRAAATAVIYRRVSSESQAGEQHVSLDVQEVRTKAYVRAKGYALAQTFTDVASGRRDDRAQYQAMLEFVRRGGASLIVTQFLDRFGRNPREILRRVWQLEEMGVKVECADEDISQEMVLLIRSGMAGAESKRIGERVRHTIRRAVERGMKPGVAPFGYRAVKKVDEAGRVVTVFEQDPTEAPIVREMVDLRVNRNLGLKKIADTLNAAGYGSRKGAMFSPASLAWILQNPVLMGRFDYGRHTRKDAPVLPLVSAGKDIFPAILSLQEWRALQERMSIRREESMKHGRVNLSEYLLSGVLRCGYCGAAMAGNTSRQHRYYVCGNRVKSTVRCAIPGYHRAGDLEEAVLKALSAYADPAVAKELLAGDKGRDANRREEKELKAIDMRLADAERGLKAALTAMAAGSLDDDQFRRISLEERTDRQRLQERRATLDTTFRSQKDQAARASAIPAKIKGFLESATTLPIQQQKARLQEIVKAIRVTRESVEIEWR